MKNFFPLASYSKPLARKIGLESAVLLFELAKDYGDDKFPITLAYINSIGIETANWAKDKLTKEGLIVSYNEELFKIDYEKLASLLNDDKSITTKKMSGDCINACKKWIAHLKKKGISKDLGQFLNEVKEKDELDLCSAIQYSIDNGYRSLFFKDHTGTNQRSRINTTGDKTDSDKGRDYSGLVKKAGS
jgi:hypothetical protein